MPSRYIKTGGSFVQLDGGSDVLGWKASDAVGSSAASGQITVAASATPHTPGSWVQVVASLGSAIQAVSIFLRAETRAATTDSSTLLDIGVGSSGSETVVVSSIPIGYGTIGQLVTIPAVATSGQRLAVRIRSVTASKSVTLTVLGLTGVNVGNAVAIGDNTANSRGTILSASAGVTSPGSWTQITASTAANYQAFVVGVQGGSDTSLVSAGMRVEIGIGAASSETVIGNVFYTVTSGTLIQPATTPPFIISNVPSGTRIAARYYSHASNSCDLILHAIPS